MVSCKLQTHVHTHQPNLTSSHGRVTLFSAHTLIRALSIFSLVNFMYVRATVLKVEGHRSELRVKGQNGGFEGQKSEWRVEGQRSE